MMWWLVMIEELINLCHEWVNMEVENSMKLKLKSSFYKLKKK